MPQFSIGDKVKYFGNIYEIKDIPKDEYKYYVTISDDMEDKTHPLSISTLSLENNGVVIK